MNFETRPMLLLCMVLAVLSFTVSFSTNSVAPETDELKLPLEDFNSPLKLPLLLSGNFGELRNNHFHTGLDIKTQAKQGFRVYASAEGHVSRIRVSAGGYGNALYVDHPNGYTTVYAHLLSFNDEITDYVREQQELNEKFGLDIDLAPGTLELDSGEVLGLSGNSGSSSGPHLHYEVRETVSERAVNPLLHGIKVIDNVAPTFNSLKVYAADINSIAVVEMTNGSEPRVASYGNPIFVPIKKSGRNFSLAGVSEFRVTGRIGFAAEVKDYHDGSRSRLGVYDLKLKVDGETTYRHIMDSFHFDDLRFINAHVDYEEWLGRKKWLHRAHLLPGNNIDIYDQVASNGYLQVEADTRHELSFEASDIEGNTSKLQWSVIGERANISLPAAIKRSNEKMIYFDSKQSISTSNFDLKFDSHSFYDDFPLSYSEENHSAISTVLNLAPAKQAIHKYFDIWLTPSSTQHLSEKTLIVHEDHKGTKRALSTSVQDDRLYARARGLGRFYASTDTKPPSIRILSAPRKMNYRKASSIKFRIRDNLSGIESFRGTIDGEWVLFEHDGKSAKITHQFDRSLSRGKHEIRLVVTDGVGNSSVYEKTFTR